MSHVNALNLNVTSHITISFAMHEKNKQKTEICRRIHIDMHEHKHVINFSEIDDWFISFVSRAITEFHVIWYNRLYIVRRSLCCCCTNLCEQINSTYNAAPTHLIIYNNKMQVESFQFNNTVQIRHELWLSCFIYERQWFDFRVNNLWKSYYYYCWIS